MLGALIILLSILHIPSVSAKDTKWVEATTDSGEVVYLPDDRKPALYTQNFGDCLGSSTINVTRFDAAYYKDNMTILFHLEGNTAVKNESLMSGFSTLYIRITKLLTACSVHRSFCIRSAAVRPDLQPMQCPNLQVCATSFIIYMFLIPCSLCPMNKSVPIEAYGVIPVAQSDVAGIPPIALSIPDFEGQAILRIFSNSTESEIACYSAIVTNGATFSHPAAVGTALGIFTLVALGASFATAVYGDQVPTIRTHYAHSLSVFVVFSVLQHVYFTGALSLNWPSVLSAFWSNYAWAGGMIYTQSMQNSINQLIGSNKGNTSMVGAAGPGAASNNIGGGYQISQIYKRSLYGLQTRDWVSVLENADTNTSHVFEKVLSKRAGPITDASDGYSWYGHPVKPGLPLPGNFSGFAGTLAEEEIPASNAFMTGFLWWLILMVLVAVAVIGFKWSMEALTNANLLKIERLAYFRAHWLGFTALALLRACFIAFFMMMFLTLFQFTYTATGGATAVAAIMFLVFFVGMLGLAGYACFYRLRFGHYEIRPDRIHFEKSKGLGSVPFFRFGRNSKRSEKSEQQASGASIPFLSVNYVSEDTQRLEVQQDEEYIKKFGWLASRFRRTRWWFFAVWLVYEFVRACFFAGSAGRAMTQVLGLLVVEIIALVAFYILKPFEGARLNALMIYLLSFSKVSTLGLSIAFHGRFNLPRITTTILGIVIIVIQGFLTIVLLIAIVIGAISSYMSIMRDREDFRPKSWEKYRQRYFAHLVKVAPDVPPPPPPPPEEPKEPYFSVNSFRRVAKIEDEDADLDDKMDAYASHTSVAGPANHRSRTASLKSHASVSNLPYGARPHRQSWSNRDFHSASWYEAGNRDPGLMSRTTLPTHKASDASLEDNIQMRRFGSPMRPGTPQRGFSSPQRTGTPQGLPLSARNPSMSPTTTPRDSAVLDIRKSRHGKERAVEFADESKGKEREDTKTNSGDA